MDIPSKQQYGREELERAGKFILRRLMSTLRRKGNFDPAIFVIGPEAKSRMCHSTTNG